MCSNVKTDESELINDNMVDKLCFVHGCDLLVNSGGILFLEYACGNVGFTWATNFDCRRL
jgi:hypothetical protein